MVIVAGSQSELLCPSCAGQCLYDPGERGLKCQSCGNVHDLSTEDDHKASVEHGYDPDAPMEEVPIPEDRKFHHCETCGGNVVFTGTSLSDRCPYCDGPVVLGTEDMRYVSTALIPFRVQEKDAQAYAQNWARQRRAAPNDLGRIVAKGRVAGLYAPFWTFDSDEAIQYWAKYTTGSGDNRRTHNTSGSMTVKFNDLLMPASHHVTPLIRDGILHDFRPNDLRPYRAGYMAGFAAERHHQTVREGLAANEKDKALLIRNRIKLRINTSGVHAIRYKTDTTGIHYRRVLLPVWILHYKYDDKPMKIVVSGIDGRTFGERPFSTWKLVAYSATVSAVTILLGWLWGAAGLL